MKNLFLLLLFISASTISYSQTDSLDNKIFTFVEKVPVFKGGDAALIKFLQKNIIYPNAERLNDIQGKVITRFVVNKNGKVTDVAVIKSSGSDGLDKEAIRVVKKLPKFEPGTQQGKRVRVYYNLPIIFKLN
jgi:protein TonB